MGNDSSRNGIGYFPEPSGGSPADQNVTGGAPKRRSRTAEHAGLNPSGAGYRPNSSAQEKPSGGSYGSAGEQPGLNSSGVGYRPAAAEPAKPAAAPMKRFLRPVLLAVCCGVFAFSAVMLIRYFSDIVSSRRAGNELQAIYEAAENETAENESAAADEEEAGPEENGVPEETPNPETTADRNGAETQPITVSSGTNPPAADEETSVELWPSVYPGNKLLRISSTFYELREQNSDIVGWLTLDGLLNEAVVQRDNEYYLTHNSLKQQSVTGALFLDEACDLTTVPGQLLIHGHNMKEGSMFGILKQYKVKDVFFYKQHAFVDMNTLYENGRYVIFAALECDLRSNQEDYLPYWRYVRFDDAKEFSDYVFKIKSLSKYHTDIDVVPGDRLLVLSTCSGNDSNKRFLVVARKIRSGENEADLNTAIFSATDR